MRCAGSAGSRTRRSGSGRAGRGRGLSHHGAGRGGRRASGLPAPPQPRRGASPTPAWWPTRCSRSCWSAATSPRPPRSPCGWHPRRESAWPWSTRAPTAWSCPATCWWWGPRRSRRAGAPGSTTRSPAGVGGSRPGRSSRPEPTVPPPSSTRWPAPWADDLAGARLVDAYAGVGLFAGSLLAGDLPAGIDPAGLGGGRRALAARRWPTPATTSRTSTVRVIKSDVDAWRSSPADVVVADPSRAGLGRRAVEVLASSGAAVVVLVSCDAASLGRDAALLAAPRLPARGRRAGRPVPPDPPRRGRVAVRAVSGPVDRRPREGLPQIWPSPPSTRRVWPVM